MAFEPFYSTNYDGNVQPDGKEFCAGLPADGGLIPGVKSLCKGDSGSALLCDVNGRITFSGVLSRTTLYEDNCGMDGHPGVFADVFSYSKWIEETVASFAAPITPIWDGKLESAEQVTLNVQPKDSKGNLEYIYFPDNGIMKLQDAGGDYYVPAPKTCTGIKMDGFIVTAKACCTAMMDEYYEPVGVWPNWLEGINSQMLINIKHI